MSKPSGESSPDKVLVALDALSQGRAAIEAAAALAADLRAELRGLFIKNTDLLRLAALPLTAEVGYASPLPRQLDRDSLERTLQAQAEQLGRTLAEAAERVQVQWSFEVACGQILQAAMAAAAECELLIVGLEGRAPRPATGFPPSLAGRTKDPTIVVFDGTAAAGGALAIAERLAQENGGGLVVLTAAPDAALARALRSQATDLPFELQAKTSLCDALVTDAESLVQAARQLHGKTLVINRDSFLLTDATLEVLMNELACPLVVVR